MTGIPASLTAADRTRLIEAAQRARQHAYAPYSGYAVGAALLTMDGTIVTGCNVENASYGATICAERTALVKAVSEGVRGFLAIAVVTPNGGSPCGICRQALYEFNPKLLVIVADSAGATRREVALFELLPEGFGPLQLADDSGQPGEDG
jgi:cytidine deaminase